MKSLLKLITAIAVMLGGLAFVAPAASATEPSSGTEIITSNATSSSSTTARAHAVNGVSITSKTQVVSYIQAKGATKSQLKAKSFRLKKSMRLWTSYYNTSGQEVWHWKTYPKGKKFVWGKDGWYHDPVCWNKVKIKVKKTVPAKRKLYGKIKVVSKFVFEAEAESTVNGDANATARAWCKTDSSAAEATGSGNAVFMASASASAYGRTWASAKAAASSSASGKLALAGHTDTSVKLKVRTEAEGKATANATAKVSCADTPTQPPTHDECPNIPGDQPEGYECYPPAPVDHKPAVNIMGSPAHLYVGGNAYVWIEASDPDGDAVSVKVSASGAGTVAGLVPVDIRWDGTPCPSGTSCYRATAWAGDTPGDMTITATVTANGLSGEPDSVTFPVKADEF